MEPDHLLHFNFSSVVFCDRCGGLFGIWLELRVPLGIFFVTEALLSPSYPTHPSFISVTPDITVVLVKASQNQAEQTISDE